MSEFDGIVGGGGGGIGPGTFSIGSTGTVIAGTGAWTFNNSALTIWSNTTVYGTLYWPISVQAVTASPKAVGDAERGRLYTNEGASGAITFNLPAASGGRHYYFYVQSANNMVITAAAGDTIRIAGSVSSSGGTATNGTVGSFIHLVEINATEWVAMGTPAGTWVLA